MRPPPDQCCAQRIHGVASGDTAGGYPRGVTATIHPTPGPATLPVRLHGSKAPAIALGLLMVLVVGVIELAIGEAHHLAGWWWAPVLMVLPVVLLVAQVVRGVQVDADGDVLVVRRLLTRHRIPASGISDIRSSGVVGERVEVVRSTGRTWSFAAPDSPDTERQRAVAAALRWLQDHGGPVPVRTGPLQAGELVGFEPPRGEDWVAGVYVLLELFLLAMTLWRLHTDPGLAAWLGWLAVASEVAALVIVGSIAGPRVGLRARVEDGPRGGMLRIHRSLAPDTVLAARDVRSVQVTLRGREGLGLRVLGADGWHLVPAGLRLHDRGRCVTRFVAWLEQHGARLEASGELPARLGPRAIVSLVVLLGSWLLAAGVIGRVGPVNIGGLGGLFGGLFSMVVGRSRVADARGLEPDAPILDAFPQVPVSTLDDPPRHD